MGNVESIPEQEKEVVNLSQFKIIKTIGQGAFGKVFQVEHVQRKESYALKVILKGKCIKMEAVANIIRERTILESLDHPLVCNMRFAFQDENTMFMAMDLMSGGDLRSHISSQQHDESTIRFWMAELICAVKYLHSQGIVHRDIKPDNILLDHEGHIHLSDFNIACQIPNKKHKKPLSSLSGTAVYFAPEMFKSNGYNEDVDWWSVGITFYECIYGIRPWTHCTNIDELGKQIVHKNISFPKRNSKAKVSMDCISAIQSFLERNPKERMGHGIISGWSTLASHPFFRSIDWYRIDSKQSQPVYTPHRFNEKDFNDILLSSSREQPQQYEQQLEKLANNQSILQQMILEEEDPLLQQQNNDGVMGWLLQRPRRSSRTPQQENRFSQDMKLLQDKFKSFDYTIFDKYEGFLDERLMTVGPPPDWVKPAFPGADNGSLLPIRKLYLETTPSVFDVFSNSTSTADHYQHPHHHFHVNNTPKNNFPTYAAAAY